MATQPIFRVIGKSENHVNFVVWPTKSSFCLRSCCKTGLKPGMLDCLFFDGANSYFNALSIYQTIKTLLLLHKNILSYYEVPLGT